MLAFWLRDCVGILIEQRRADMPIQAVLDIAVSDEAAVEAARRLEAETPGMSAEAVDSKMARMLLSLQEPWMEELPDVEIGRLPAILKIHHPQLLTDRGAVESFIARLEALPEVDFVLFNTTGWEQVLAFCGAAVTATRFVTWLLLVLFGAGYLLSGTGAAPVRGPGGVAAAVVASLVMAVLAGAVAWAGLRVLAGVLATHGAPLPPPSFAVGAMAVALAFVLRLLLMLRAMAGQGKDHGTASA